ncbi:MAG TPA: YegS/Rv2252/BmrU family lipid kinase [Papillibacter sp.]|nr:YegS/Rv2252/BmrU family lipid kinase [Papillibacter sp.]
MKNVLLIVNPHSGRGLPNSALGVIVSSFCQAGYGVTVYTTHSGTCTELAEKYGPDFDLVVCVGGDGTLSNVASGLMRIENRPPVGYIPTGTANDMATTLALSKDPRIAVASVINGQPTPIDIGRMGEQYFTYVAAFGAFTGVSYKTKQSAKRALGHLAYVLGGLASMKEIKPRHTIIEYEGGSIEGEFIFGAVTNSTSIAGFVRLDNNQVNLADGVFEIILVRHPVTAADLGEIIDSIVNKTYNNDNVLLLHAKEVVFRFDEEVEWTRDGEDGGVHKTLRIVNNPKALQMML